MTELQVYHSIIDARSLIDWLQERYAWPTIQSCHLIRLGLNDTYEIRTNEQRYIVRLYRAKWRSIHEVQAEIELLSWLAAKNFAIAAPIEAKDGCNIHRFVVSEGERAIVAFEYVQGSALKLDASQAFVYGQSLANFHQLTNDFCFQSSRFCLDEQHLIAEPLSHIERAFGHHTAEVKHIQKIAQQAAKIMTSLPKTHEIYGLCHGDHFGNVFSQTGKGLTFIDFDCCGLGYRIYDIVQFYWAIHLRIPIWRESFHDSNPRLWQAFLQGYQQIRPLHQSEIAALPAMLIIRSLWGLGLQPQNEQHWGCEGHERIWQQNYPLFENSTEINHELFSGLSVNALG